MNAILLTKRTVCLCVLAALIIDAKAPAQTPSTPESTADTLLQEVTVTARKRDESLQEVPISVTALSAERLTALNVDNSEDIAFFTPNFTWNSEFGKSSPQVYLRGVGSNNFMPNNTGPIAVYQDHVYHGPNITHAFAAFDLDRVEVLKGPQGTLYGRNSTGGLINFISRKPEVGGDVDGFVSLELGDYDTVGLQTALGFPISDTVAARAAFSLNRNEGYWKSRDPSSGSKTAGDVDDMAMRIQLAVEPSEALTILFNLHGAKSTPGTEPFKSIGMNCAPGVAPGFSLETGSACPDIFGFSDTPDPYDTFGNEGQEELEAIGGFAQIVYDLGAVELTSLTAYDVAEGRRLDDSDAAPTLHFNVHLVDDFDYFSQELRFSGSASRMDWHVGGYFYDEVYKGHSLIDIFELDPNAFGVDKKFETESYAFFAEGNFRLTEKLRATAGARWTTERRTIDRFEFLTYNSTGRPDLIEDLDSLTGINAPTFLDIRTDTKKTFDEPTWRLSLDYSVNDNVMLYTSLSRGFKGGEINGLPGATEPTRIIEPEILDAVEVGLKSTLLDGRLVFNTAAFYYDYQDQQVSTFADQFGNSVAVLDNATSSELWGADAEIVWAPTPQLYINVAVGTVDANYGDFFSEFAGALSGNRIPFTPELEGTLLARYEWALAGGGAISVQGDVQYTGDMYFQPTNVEYLSEGGYSLFNAALRYQAPNQRWSATLYGKNIGGKEYFTSGFETGPPLFPSQIKIGPPRYVALRFDYHFGM